MSSRRTISSILIRAPTFVGGGCSFPLFGYRSPGAGLAWKSLVVASFRMGGPVNTHNELRFAADPPSGDCALDYIYSLTCENVHKECRPSSPNGPGREA